MQAQRYAEIEANKLSLLAYEELDAKVSQNKWTKTEIDSDWEYNIKLDAEKILSSSKNSKQRIATVSVRKVGDQTERFSMKVPVSDNGGNAEFGEGYVKLNNGLIIQYGIEKPICGEYRKRVYFPIQYPNKVFSVSGSPMDIGINLNWTFPAITNQYFERWSDDGGCQYFHWMSIGY